MTTESMQKMSTVWKEKGCWSNRRIHYRISYDPQLNTVMEAKGSQVVARRHRKLQVRNKAKGRKLAEAGKRIW